MLARRGLITPPWGTPHRVACRCPSTMTPARSHWSINVSTRRSLMRRRTRPRRISWSTWVKKPSMSASTTHHRRTSAAFTASTACPALRLGRYPYEHGKKLASKSGSMTILHACWTTRSRTVGMPRGRVRPSGFGNLHPQHWLWAIHPGLQLRGERLQDTRRPRDVPHLRCVRHRPRRAPDLLAPLTRPATAHRAGRCGRTERGTDGSHSSWPHGTVRAGGLVTFLLGVVGSDEHAPSRPSPLDLVEAGALPSDAVLLSAPSTVMWPPPTSESPDIKVGRSQRTGTTCAVSPAHLSSSNNHRLNTLRRLLAAAEQAPQPERGLRRRPSTEARKYCSGRSQKNP